MTSRDFCYWLQGFFELTAEQGMAVEQTEIVKRHLAMVFHHEIDPSMGGKAQQAALDAIHKPNPDHKMSPITPAPSIGGQSPDGILYRC